LRRDKGAKFTLKQFPLGVCSGRSGQGEIPTALEKGGRGGGATGDEAAYNI